jgi:hypothetical protein
MERGIVFFIAILGGLLVIGIAKNVWTRFAITCLTIILVAGVLIYAVTSFVQIYAF